MTPGIGVVRTRPVAMATVERDDALKFAARTLQNLRFVQEVWLSHRQRQQDPPVRLVTQTINSMLGLVMFTVEKKFVRETLKETVGGLIAKGWPAFKFELGGSPQDSLGELAYHLRNSAGHGRVRFSSDSTDPADVEVSFEDAKNKSAPANWRVSITAADLLKFCFLYGDHVDEVIGYHSCQPSSRPRPTALLNHLLPAFGNSYT